MNQQITDYWEDIAPTHGTSRQFAAYVVFGLSMGFLFGTLVDSLFVGVLLGVAVGSLSVIRPDFHRPATIDRENACTKRAGTSELDIWRSEIILPTRYGEEAGFGSVKRADALLDDVDVQGSSACVQILNAVTDREQRTPGGSDTVH